MSYENILNFYQVNKELLITGSLRPAKSITRNIFTGVMPFILYYRQNHKTEYNEKEIAREILELNCDFSSTSRDNIRNMQELKFMSKADDRLYYHLTQNFIEFCNSGLTVREYILQDLRRIHNVYDITMFYNCILCTLIEGIKRNEIILYPESFGEFEHMVPDRIVRNQMCQFVYETYGFKGTGNAPIGMYTPNANYRIVSTCVDLGLIKRDGVNSSRFKKYKITNLGFSILQTINDNLN